MIEIETGANPVASVIWLHGLGADGHDFEPIVPELGLSAPVRFVFPHAPERAVTINNGMRMRAWYDIFQFGGGPEDEAGIRDSQQLLGQMISAEKTKKIFLAGFSQGGAIVLQTALRYPKKLAGVLALSCYLPLAAKLPAEKNQANQDIPVFMAHGTLDPVVPIQKARMSRDVLEQQGYKVEWHEYPMPHSVCPQEIGDIAAFMTKLL